MNIKNIKGYAKRINLAAWTKSKLASARSYNDVKNVFIEELELENFLLRNAPEEYRKICEKRIQQAKNILRLMGY